LTDSIKLLRRLEFGPRLKGAQTAPIGAQAIDEAADRLASAAAPRAKMVFGWVKSALTSEQDLAAAMSTPEGIDAFNAALNAAVRVKNGKRVSERAVRAMIHSWSQVSASRTADLRTNLTSTRDTQP
jgi:hypothetical protein